MPKRKRTIQKPIECGLYVLVCLGVCVCVAMEYVRPHARVGVFVCVRLFVLQYIQYIKHTIAEQKELTAKWHGQEFNAHTLSLAHLDAVVKITHRRK